MGLQQDIGELVLMIAEENRKHNPSFAKGDDLAREYFAELEYLLNHPQSNEENDARMGAFQHAYVKSSSCFVRRKGKQTSTGSWTLQALGLTGLIGILAASENWKYVAIGTTIAVLGLGTHYLRRMRQRMESFCLQSLNTFENYQSKVLWYRALQKYEPQLREQIAAYKKEQAA